MALYNQYHGKNAMNRVYFEFAERYGIKVRAGDECAYGPPGEVGWHGQGLQRRGIIHELGRTMPGSDPLGQAVVGRLFCSRRAGTVGIRWPDTDTLTFQLATWKGGELDALVGWWLYESGPSYPGGSSLGFSPGPDADRIHTG
jgi:hypothetical protein